jgi:hypothetical protein
VVNVPKLVKRRLTDILLEEGLLKEEVLAEAMNRQKQSGESLPVILQKMGVLAEIDLARAIAKQYNLPYIDASKYKTPRDVMDAIPIETLRHHQFVPIDKIGKTMLLAISNVAPMEILEALERQTGSTFFLYVSTVTQVNTALTRLDETLKGKRPAPAPAAPAAPAKPAAPAPGTAVRQAPSGPATTAVPRPAPSTPTSVPRPTGVFPKPQAQGLPSPLSDAPPQRPPSGVFPPNKPASASGR